MKVSDILLNYLLKHKNLPLPGLGTFLLTGSYVMSDDDKSVILPPGAIEFKLDPKTAVDDQLIDVIASDTGKFKPLAIADLEALVVQGKQLLNISKPFVLEGIGTLQKDHRGDVEFIPYTDSSQRHESDKRLEEPGEAIRFNENYLRPAARGTNKSRGIAMAALLLLAIGLIGWVGYYFYHSQRQEDKQTISLSDPPAATPVSDTSATLPAPTQNLVKDSPVSAATTPVSTGAAPVKSADSFRVVIEVAKKDRAVKRYADLREWGHKVTMVQSDSGKYKIFFPIKASLSDTSRYRDSLSRFFGRKVWIEKN